MRDDPETIGPYRIEGFLGKGGMATVYQGRSIDGRQVAIKVVHSEFAGQARYVSRFIRECEATRKLDHPAIVTIFDVGKHEGTPYYVMEYLPFDTLEERIEEQGRLSERDVRILTAAFLDGCSYYSSRGMIHRDLKPSNVLVRPDGTPVITDFGLVKVFDATALTRTGELLGTPAYLPPETIQGRQPDIRGDLYQWGVIAYECLAGDLPFEFASPADFIVRAAAGKVIPLLKVAPETSPGFVVFVANCLAVEAEERYQTPEEAAVDFARLERGESIALIPPRSDAALGVHGATRTHRAKVLQTVTAPSTIRRWLLLGVAVVAAIALVALLWPEPLPVPTPHVRVGYRKVAVAWNHPRPLRTRAVVATSAGTEEVAAEDGDARSEHLLVLALPESPRADLFVTLRLLPDGPVSKAVAVRPRPLAPVIQAIDVTEDGLTVELRPGTKIHDETEFLIGLTQATGARREGAVERRERRLVAIIPGARPDVAGLELFLKHTATEELETIDLTDAFCTWADRLVAPAKALNGHKIISGVVKEALERLLGEKDRDIRLLGADGSVKPRRLQEASPERRERFEKKLSLMRERVRGQPWADTLMALAHNQTVLLSSPLLPIEEQADVFRASLTVNVLNQCFLARGWLPFSGRTYACGPTWGFYWSTELPSSSSWRQCFRWVLPEKDQRIGGYALTPWLVDPSSIRRTYEWELTGSQLAGKRRCCLCLNVPKLPHRLYVRAQVNNSPAFVASTYITAAAITSRAIPWFCQHFPADLLHRGKNVLLIEGKMFPGFFSTSKDIALTEAILLIE